MKVMVLLSRDKNETFNSRRLYRITGRIPLQLPLPACGRKGEGRKAKAAPLVLPFARVARKGELEGIL
jgi:hypothetical protein